MRIKNDSIVSAGDMSADITGDTVFIGHIYGFAVQAVWTGTPQGTIKVQGSCDLGRAEDDPTGVSHWDDISTQAAGGAAGTKLFNLDAQHYRWVRVVYTKSSSTGTLNARINLKGV